jgi:hypothetical protein
VAIVRGTRQTNPTRNQAVKKFYAYGVCTDKTVVLLACGDIDAAKYAKELLKNTANVKTVGYTSRDVLEHVVTQDFEKRGWSITHTRQFNW